MSIIITQDKATSMEDSYDTATSTDLEEGHEHNNDTEHHSDPADDDSDATTQIQCQQEKHESKHNIYVFPILIVCSCRSTNFGRLPKKPELWGFRQ